MSYELDDFLPAESLFEKFWDAYPKKTGKHSAQQLWDRIEAEGEIAPHALIEDVKARRERVDQWKRGFIPAAPTYLREKRWMDDLPEPKRDRVAENEFDAHIMEPPIPQKWGQKVMLRWVLDGNYGMSLSELDKVVEAKNRFVEPFIEIPQEDLDDLAEAFRTDLRQLLDDTRKEYASARAEAGSAES